MVWQKSPVPIRRIIRIFNSGIGLVRAIELLFEFRRMLDPSEVTVLNPVSDASVTTISEPDEIVALSQALHKEILRLKGKFMQENGAANYSNLKCDPDFEAYVRKSGKLQAVDLTLLEEDHKMAFFLNVYNTLSIHALAEHVTTETSVLQLKRFWQGNGYKIGENVFSLDDIEHGILRCNKPHPTFKARAFKTGDPRAKFSMNKLDPRIHFSLNCGAKSCPPIRLFSAENLEVAMTKAAQSFCQQDITIDVPHKSVTCSKLLSWYGVDFGNSAPEIMERLMPFLNQSQHEAFEKIKDNFKMTFSEYDWTIH